MRDLVLAQVSALDVHEVVPIEKKVSNQSSLDDGERTFDLLAGLGHDRSGDDHSLARGGVLDMTHQLDACEMRLDATPHRHRLPYVQRLETLTPSTGEDVKARTFGKPVEIDSVCHILNVGHRDRAAPPNTQLHLAPPDGIDACAREC